MTDLELRGLGPGVNGEQYVRRLHPESSILLPTDKNDPRGFRSKIAGILLRAGDRDDTGQLSESSAPAPWYPYDAHYECVPMPEDAIRLIEGMGIMAMKIYGVFPKDAEPVFLTQGQMDDAGFYNYVIFAKLWRKISYATSIPAGQKKTKA